MKLQQLALLGIFAISPFILNSQKNTATDHPIMCGQHLQQARLYEENPQLRVQDSIDQASFDDAYQQYMLTYDPSERSTYTVPVVVHVVHLGGEENISNQQINNALEKLNEDFSMSNPDLGNTVSAFTGIIGNADIEFKLATKDPNGNCHSGITRTFSNTTYDTGMSQGSHPIVDAVAAQHGVWPQGEYMSIFVCIDPIGAAGYTYNPSNGFNQNQMYGAIFMRHDYMGVIGTSSNTARHTLAHEVGHWLNLSHLWGSTNSPNVASNCNVDDGVSDTPNTIGWQSCALQGTSCGSLDNVQNIMEYSYCSTMFTQGQAARMQTAINSGIAGRNGLITNTNLANTGVLTTPTDICAAEFISNTRVICQGQSISFQDVSVHGVTNRNWTFTGGTPAIATDSVVDVTYNVAGDYSVTLEVSNGSNTETTTVTNYIKVLPVPGTGFPYSEGFEGITQFPDNETFTVFNPGSDNTWQITGLASSTGNKSVYINNYSANTESFDEFISGPIDLSVLDPSESVTFTFDYAYSKKNVGDDEWLRVYASADCGESWVLRKTIHGSILGNQVTGTNFVPSEDDWKTVSVTNINSSYYVPNFRFKFRFESENGNNIFVDNINITAPGYLSINENHTVASKISVYPNPTTNLSIINLEGYENTEVSVALYNVMGQKITQVYNGTVESPSFITEVDLTNLTKGLYFIKLDTDQAHETIKLIKE
jgi:PKD repeat protein